MARPKKIDTEKMICIVNSFFESNGDPAMLKYTLLENYAASLGAEIKEYDFRRDKSVRLRIDELQQSFMLEGMGIVAFKNIDIDAMLNRNRTREKLQSSLQELNDFWRQVYEKANVLSQTNKSLLTDNFKLKGKIKTLATEIEESGEKVQESKTQNNRLIIENRFLKRMLKQYLYPALANEILKNDNILSETDTEVTKLAMDKIASANIPPSFSGAVSADIEMLSREEKLFERMNSQITEES